MTPTLEAVLAAEDARLTDLGARVDATCESIDRLMIDAYKAIPRVTQFIRDVERLRSVQSAADREPDWVYRSDLKRAEKLVDAQLFLLLEDPVLFPGRAKGGAS